MYCDLLCVMVNLAEGICFSHKYLTYDLLFIMCEDIAFHEKWLFMHNFIKVTTSELLKDFQELTNIFCVNLY